MTYSSYSDNINLSNKEGGKAFMSEGNVKNPYDILIMPEGVHVITGSFDIYKSIFLKRDIQLQAVKDLIDSVIPFVRLNFSRVNILDLDNKSLALDTQFIVDKYGIYFYDYESKSGVRWIYVETILDAVLGRYPKGCTNIRDYTSKYSCKDAK